VFHVEEFLFFTWTQNMASDDITFCAQWTLVNTKIKGYLAPPNEVETHCFLPKTFSGSGRIFASEHIGLQS
jgi:hypothetical protein